LFPQTGRPPTQPAALDLQAHLAGTAHTHAGTANHPAATDPRDRTARAPQPRQLIRDLRQFHLQAPLAGTDPAFTERMGTPHATSRPFPVLSVLYATTGICMLLEALLFGRHSAVITLSLVAVTMAFVLIGPRGRRRQ
jgi:hypothetical protein